MTGHNRWQRELSQTANASNTAAAQLTPFSSIEVFDDTLLHVLGFVIVLVAAHPIATFFPRYLKLPLITGYLLVGVVTGPFLTNLIPTKSVQMLASSVNAMALSFISFQAGQEIYLPELKPQIKGILQLLAVLYVTAMALLTTVLTLGAGPFFYGGFDTSCQLAIALLFGSIAVLGSPATVMAIKIELRSAGPFTSLMLGATMTAEFVVLVSFSVARVVTSVYCAKLDVSVANLFFTLGVVLGNVVVGAAIGAIILAIFVLPGASPLPGHHHHQPGQSHGSDDDDEDEPIAVLSATPSSATTAGGAAGWLRSLYFKGFLWLFVGYLFYISTALLSSLSIAAYGHAWDVKFEPLLVLMVGACLAGHHAHVRHEMHAVLDAAAPFVFLPFFVMTGAALKLDQVANAIPLMSLFVSLRYAAIFLACYGAGRWLLRLPPHQYNNLWLTMTPQAGVALGLANEIKSLSSDPWAQEFAATIVAAVVVNQIVGPVLCAMGLSRAGETGDRKKEKKQAEGTSGGDALDLESGAGGGGAILPSSHRGGEVALATVRRAVVIGDDDVAKEIALQLSLHGADVAMPTLADAATSRWEAMQSHVRRAFPSSSSSSSPPPHSDAGGGNSVSVVVFTGDTQRAVEYVKMLATLGSPMPRLVGVFATSSPAQLQPLRQLGVVCIQSSMALANVGVRTALMTEALAVNMASTEAAAVAERQSVFEATLSAGASSPELHRALLHRRRVLQRNVQSVRQCQGAPGGTNLPQQPSMGVAPQRVSMFGRASAVEFLGTGRGAHRQSGFFVPNEVYVMGGGQNGEGGFEAGPSDDLDPDSTRGGAAYVSAATNTPNGTLKKFLTRSDRQFKPLGALGNHRRS